MKGKKQHLRFKLQIDIYTYRNTKNSNLFCIMETTYFIIVLNAPIVTTGEINTIYYSIIKLFYFF